MKNTIIAGVLILAALVAGFYFQDKLGFGKKEKIPTYVPINPTNPENKPAAVVVEEMKIEDFTLNGKVTRLETDKFYITVGELTSTDGTKSLPGAKTVMYTKETEFLNVSFKDGKVTVTPATAKDVKTGVTVTIHTNSNIYKEHTLQANKVDISI